MTLAAPGVAVPAQPVIACLGHVHGCPRCRAEPLRRPWPHVCDHICVHQAANRSTPAGHARSHRPRRHTCGAMLDDRTGRPYEVVDICGWGTCVRYSCPGCGAFLSGFGPVGCGCETRPCGHGSFTADIPDYRRRRLRDLLRHT